MAKATTNKEIKTASVLAFERKLECSDAVFEQSLGLDGDNTPVVVREKSVRGTISNRLKANIANDEEKLKSEVEKANLQTVEIASLDSDKDTLHVKWSCKVIPFDGTPAVCNNSAYQTKLEQSLHQYIKTTGFGELAHRYAYNIINGRWLWRNRMGAETIHIKVNAEIDGVEKTLDFGNIKPLPLSNFNNHSPELKQLTQWIDQGLKGEAFVILNVIASAKMGFGQEVYPSQELILDDTKNKKSKILYRLGEKAGFHSQKISNAIRTIDTWYEENEAFPIAVEPYGAVTNMGAAFRKPKIDFYTMFDAWILKDEDPSLENQHYIVAMLIRGGVFGAASKE